MKIQCVHGEHLSEAEQAAVNFINDQSSRIDPLSISDIASGAFVSNATVSRAIRKCGFSSLSEMKVRLSDDKIDNRSQNEINQILSQSYLECIETIKSIDIHAVIRISALIKSVQMVYILANGLTALIAHEFAVQLQCQRINVCVISDSEMMKKMDLLAKSNDLILILSVKNSTPELAIGARLAKRIGAKIVSCCCTVGTELDRVSDIIVYGHSKKIAVNRAFGGTSRIGLFIITRTIVEYLMTDEEEKEENETKKHINIELK